jgi:hypothetical protein
LAGRLEAKHQPYPPTLLILPLSMLLQLVLAHVLVLQPRLSACGRALNHADLWRRPNVADQRRVGMEHVIGCNRRPRYSKQGHRATGNTALPPGRAFSTQEEQHSSKGLPTSFRDDMLVLFVGQAAAASSQARQRQPGTADRAVTPEPYTPHLCLVFVHVDGQQGRGPAPLAAAHHQHPAPGLRGRVRA